MWCDYSDIRNGLHNESVAVLCICGSLSSPVYPTTNSNPSMVTLSLEIIRKGTKCEVVYGTRPSPNLIKL
jgi:hypothetical protein